MVWPPVPCSLSPTVWEGSTSRHAVRADAGFRRRSDGSASHRADDVPSCQFHGQAPLAGLGRSGHQGKGRGRDKDPAAGEEMMVTLNVNGSARKVGAEPDTP